MIFQNDIECPQTVGTLAGITVQDALTQHVPAHILNQPGLFVLNHGVELRREDWQHIVLREQDRLTVAVMPQGGGGGGRGGKGKSIGTIIAGIVLIVVGVMTWGATYSLNAVMMGAGLLLSGLAGLMIKPPSTNTNSNTEQTGYSVTGQSNEARPYQPVMRLYGRHKVFPALAANPIFNNAGIYSYMSVLYDFGLGWVNVSDLRVGDTPIDQFQPSLILHQNTKAPQLALCNRAVAYDQLSYVLQQGLPFVVATSQNCTTVEVDLAFPEGFVGYDDEGKYTTTSAEFDVQWAPYGTNNWQPVAPGNVVGVAAGGRTAAVAMVRVRRPTSGWVDRVYDLANQPKDRFTWFGEEVGTTDADQPLVLPNGMNGYTDPILYRVGSGNLIEVESLVPDLASAPGFTLIGGSPRPQVACVHIDFAVAGQYNVRFVRISPISTDTRIVDRAAISLVKSYIAGNVLNLDREHTMLEMKLLASEKVSGTIQNLSAIAISVLPHYDANGALLGWFETRNNAWIALDVLIGIANPKPLPLGMIDWPSWVALADYCAAQRVWNINGQQVIDQRHTCDLIVDYKTTIKELVDSILAGCRATLIITQAGKYGVAIDQRKAVPRQLITPANSWDFSSTRNFLPEIHCLRVSFMDSTRQYQKQTINVYRDGYDASNATVFEDLGTLGITDWYRAWAFGRYFMAQAVHRAEVFSLKMDAEHLAVQRGDLVHVQHDVPRIGGMPMRVVSVVGNLVELDQELSTAPSNYTVRQSDGSIRQGTVTIAEGARLIRIDDASGIAADDLMVVGLSTRVTAPYLVQSIEPDADMAAQLMLAVYEPLIYDADIGALPPWDPHWGDDLINGTDLAVTSATAVPRIVYIDRFPYEVMDISFTVNSVFYAYAEIMWERPNQASVLVDTTDQLIGYHEFSLMTGEANHYDQLDYLIIPYTEGGVRGKSMRVTGIKLKNPKPKAPPAFDLDLKRETITLYWSHPDEPDILGYEIRYDPRLVGSSFDSSTISARLIAWPMRSTEIPARLGTYYIKTIDTARQRSDDYAVAFTPSENLWLLNAITVVDDEPDDWPGIRDGFDLRAVYNSYGPFGNAFGNAFARNWKQFAYYDGLISHEEPVGVYPWRSEYLYKEIYDGGEIYQTRFTSKINMIAYNETSFMAAWVPLAVAQPIGGWADTASGQANIGDYMNAWHEIRWLKTTRTMKDWTPLAAAEPIGYGTADWGAWSYFQVGDYTGQIFQFRLVAEYDGPADPPDCGVIIDSAWIEVDMLDRIDGQYNIICPAGGMRVLYQPAFKERPALAITPDIVSIGDNYRITNSDKNGFDIQFYDSASTPAERNFDWLAKGYGAKGTRVVPGTKFAPAKGYNGRQLYITESVKG